VCVCVALVRASGDQLKQKLDIISDSVSDNVRDKGTQLLPTVSSPVILLLLLLMAHSSRA